MDRQLKIKVCGMRDPSNIREVAGLGPDYMGFIFFPGSKRFYGEASGLPELDDSILRTGVFVDEKADEVLRISRMMGFSCVQLHGNESPELCSELGAEGFTVIKAFNISSGKDFQSIYKYTGSSDFFLFDAGRSRPVSGNNGTAPGIEHLRGGTEPLRGGTGRKFDWRLLQYYEQDTPFFLSGGIRPGDEEEILGISHPALYGVDLNSGFETGPGMKRADLLRTFMGNLKKEI